MLVSRDGSNPTAWSAALGNATSNAFVTGRYAYAIYDEGGLLDMNVAGYPTGVTAAQAGSKSALAFADLKQLPGISDLPTTGGANTLTQDELIDAFVAWRNYATTQAPAEFPTPTFTAASGLNYFKAITANTKGFLTTGNTALHNGQSDRMFASRQQLMKLLLSGIASQGTSAASKTERANIQNALQYLTHFTRDINQPSYVRIQSLDSNTPGYDSTAPKILAANAGGNNATGLDGTINPSFLMVRVKSAFTRNDESQASVGEPLVKERFALNRLAWLTCKGASGPRATSSDPDIAALKAAGISEDWLKQGTDENIRKYFGLQWTTASSGNIQANYWKYVSPAGAGSGPIKKLSEVAAANREADFFELMKATINVGSIGKAGSSVPDPSGITIQSLSNQYYQDYSVDNAIIQIGANIIDQFDSDSFPTRVVFNDGTNPATAFAGIENLPYLYRVHPATEKVVSPATNPPLPPTTTPPSNNSLYSTADTIGGNYTIQDTGLGATILIPELWNPHDWCGDNATTAQLGQTMGTMGPNASGRRGAALPRTHGALSQGLPHQQRSERPRP